METIDVEQIAASRRARRTWRPPPWRAWPWRCLVAVAMVVALAFAIDVWTGDGRRSPAEAQTEQPAPVAVLTARQETLLLHHTWLDEVEIAACMAGHGFAYSPDPAPDPGRVAAVATYLGIEPAAAPGPGPSQINALVVSGLPAASADQWQTALKQPSADGGCAPPLHLLYLNDEQTLASAVAAARADASFHDYLAQSLAVEDDPVAQLRAAVALSGQGETTGALAGWEETAARIVAAVQRDQVWIVEPPEGSATHVDVLGLAGDGSALMVRVARDPAALIAPGGPVLAPVLECGETFLQVAAWPAPQAGVDSPAADAALAAVTTRACSGGGPVLREGSSAVE